jgi:hypothetical protein
VGSLNSMEGSSVSTDPLPLCRPGLS